MTARPVLSSRRALVQEARLQARRSEGRETPDRARAVGTPPATEIVAEHSGQPLEEVSADMERDYFMTAEEAKEYGLIDNVLARRFESDARPAV
jgi:hypothetical protein